MTNCRFCGALPYYPTKIKKNKTITACPNRDCPIFGIHMTVKQWERDLPNEIIEDFLGPDKEELKGVV